PSFTFFPYTTLFRSLIRHETISGMLVCLEPRLRRWLSPLSSSFFASVWGAIGHHRKFDERIVPEQVVALTLQIAHKDFTDILARSEEHTSELQSRGH